jgi:acyl carrier protein
VRTRVACVLGRPLDAPVDAEQSLFELGMDSLTSVELRNTLQKSLACRLPSTLTFKYPNLNSLVGFLSAHVLSLDESKTVAVPKPREISASHVADLDEQEVDVLKAEQMAKLKILLQKIQP